MSDYRQVPQSFINKIRHRLNQVKLDISDGVLESFIEIPRENFVLPENRKNAYTDRPQPILSNQTISAPHMYAMMMSRELGDPHKGMTILEIGTGSGYGAALLGYVVNPGNVYTIERHRKLVDFAKANIESLNLDNIEIIHGNGTKDIPDVLFDRIIVTAAGESLPPIYKDHLKVGGKIVIPLVNEINDQWIWTYTKQDDGSMSRQRSLHVIFVPLVF